ncbi:MAG: sugar ABC transporter substrate-binding protein, partial [Pyramidobacter sp.]|nr:sugar ABC transporter substrate-binding protein [Pyramidobacter sp.]
MAYSLDIVLGDCGNPYWQEQELWYRRLLPEFGMTGTIHYPNREGDPVSQTELVEKLLTRGSEVLILNALDGDAVARTAARLLIPALICDFGETMPS